MINEYFDNQKYTMPPQSFRQHCNSIFLVNKNFIVGKNAIRSLDRSTGDVRITICLSPNAQLTRKHKAIGNTKYSILKFIIISIH